MTVAFDSLFSGPTELWQDPHFRPDIELIGSACPVTQVGENWTGGVAETGEGVLVSDSLF